ncbi:DUF3772 domain-containing protein [Shimia sp.]|uniref:DUF3772 domain-containing protein n=1 Tax=Shimia sp. TaxID=1954381 RepID=UPI00329A5260
MRPILRLILVLATLTVMFSSQVWAQDQVVPDYEAWKTVTARAEEAIENDRASESAMETLRNQLVSWRETFGDETSRLRISVQTLEAQLRGLGPEPESGDPAEVAEQRDQLTTSLAIARAPVQKAELARIEAEELIRAVDSLLRNRQASLLLTPGPVPINPSTWGDAASEIGKTFRLVAVEFVTGWVHERQRQELRHSLPKMLLFLAIAIVLITRGIRWTRSVLTTIVKDEMSAGTWVAAFFLSFGQVILPMLGVYALTEAVYATDLPGFRGDAALSVLPLVTFELLTAKWLGERIFSRRETPLLSVHLSEQEKRVGRSTSLLLGIALGANTLLGVMARYDNWAPETQSIVFFILTVIAAIMLARLALLIGRHSHELRELQDGMRSPISQLIYVISRFMLATSGISIILGAIGMTRGAAFLVFATSKTVLMIAFLLVLQRLIKKIFAALAGKGNDEEDTLLAPVIIGSFLILCSLPILALTWGARVSDLNEFWSRMAAGLRIGDTVISPKAIAVFFLVFLFGYGLTRLSQNVMRVTILPKTKVDPGGQTAIVSGLGYIGIFFAALVAINTAGIDLGNIALFAGALSVGIGFGLQTVVSNFVSGIILLIERPVSEGDWIEVGGKMGYVRDISVRSTRIETFDRTDVIVPNSDLISGTVTNFTRGNTVGRVIVPVGVAYGTDTKWVEGILREIAEAHPMVLANPAPSVVFQGFGADSLDFEIRAILRDVNWSLSVKSDMNHEIARRFGEENIEIPYAQRDIWLRNPEALTSASGPGASSGETGALSDTMKPGEMDLVKDNDGEGEDR